MLRKSIPQGYTIFTFVREPMSIFMSGYAETVHRVTVWGGARSVHSDATAYTAINCNSTAANASRFAAFIADILACRQMGYDTYHVWPQVTKLDVLPANRSFDFIGRVEHLQDDWVTLMRRLGAQPGVVSSQNPASHNVDACGKQIAVPSKAKLAVLPLLCSMLRADYECLGYRLPRGCLPQEPTAPACSATATQSAVLARVGLGAPGSSQSRAQPPPAAIVQRRAFKVTHMTMFQDVKRKVLFCLPMKSGATLLRNVVSGLGGWNLQNLRRITPEVVNTHLKVAVVRETLSRLSAAYAHAGHLVNGTKTSSTDPSAGFRRFLSAVLSMRDGQLDRNRRSIDRHFLKHVQPQVRACRPDLFNYDFVLRFETMQSDLRLLLQPLDPRASTQRLAHFFARYANCSNSSSCVARPTPSLDGIDEKMRLALLHKYQADEHWRLARRTSSLGDIAPSPGKDEAAAHIRNLRRLSSDFLSNATFRKQPWFANAPATLRSLTASLGPAMVRLSRCGSVIAPFGGHMLAAFEEHLRTYGNPIKNTASWRNASFVTMRRALGKHREKALGSGYHHLVFSLDPNDARRLQISKPVLIRTNIRGAWRDAGNTNCKTYVQSVWNGWMAWVLGELDVTPQVQAVWTEQNVSGTWTNTLESMAFKTVSILERWPSLEEVLREPLRERVSQPAEAQQLFDRIALLTQSGVVNLDIKPRDMYVRHAQDQWQMRLGDVEFGEQTGMLLDATAGCRLALTLQLPVVLFACGPLGKHKAAQSFVGHAYNWLAASQEGNWSSLAMKECWPSGSRGGSHTTGFCHLERHAVWESSLTKALIEIQHLKTRLHVIMDGIMAKGGVCPDQYRFTKRNHVQGRNPPTLSSA